MERALEVQRQRLLRVLAGLVLAVGFLSAGPFSQAFSRWARGVFSSVLSRAELASQYLVVVQARLIADRSGAPIDLQMMIDVALRNSVATECEGSVCGLRQRLRAVQTLLNDLPRRGQRLLRQIERMLRRAVSGALTLSYPEPQPSINGAARIALARIERPPDKRRLDVMAQSTSLRFRAGGEAG